MAAKMLETIYRELEGIGVVQTRSEFCTQWLGRSEGYVRTLRFCAQQPSIDVLAVLSNRLRYYAKQYASMDGNANKAAARHFEALAQQCDDDIAERSSTVWIERARAAV
ncbi:DUF6626 family protein [Spiribacter roseus]|uniref:DUF6626 family protein n=1 Tax=Spiribacter roseus TaxID=1855875 RepID=UPI00132F794F|nr:DUF6626 family protein [Spiribacter roseus]